MDEALGHMRKLVGTVDELHPGGVLTHARDHQGLESEIELVCDQATGVELTQVGRHTDPGLLRTGACEPVGLLVAGEQLPVRQRRVQDRRAGEVEGTEGLHDGDEAGPQLAAFRLVDGLEQRLRLGQPRAQHRREETAVGPEVLRPGDWVTVSVEQLGSIESVIVPGASPLPLS